MHHTNVENGTRQQLIPGARDVLRGDSHYAPTLPADFANIDASHFSQNIARESFVGLVEGLKQSVHTCTHIYNTTTEQSRDPHF